MDTFMDKLAQKLTAQEMIKANSAADAEEMGRMKQQIQEYENILSQMQTVTADSLAKIEAAKVDGEQIDRMVEAGIQKIEQMQTNTGLSQEVKESLEEFKTSLEELKASLEEWKTTQDEKLNHVTEDVHKECVKVYRNVQAVVVEENGKQTESITAAVNGVKGKLGAILGVSIVSLIIALAGVVLNCLHIFNILL